MNQTRLLQLEIAQMDLENFRQTNKSLVDLYHDNIDSINNEFEIKMQLFESKYLEQVKQLKNWKAGKLQQQEQLIETYKNQENEKYQLIRNLNIETENSLLEELKQKIFVNFPNLSHETKKIVDLWVDCNIDNSCDHFHIELHGPRFDYEFKHRCPAHGYEYTNVKIVHGDNVYESFSPENDVCKTIDPELVNVLVFVTDTALDQPLRINVLV
jgi:hypothetical protein